MAIDPHNDGVPQAVTADQEGIPNPAVAIRNPAAVGARVATDEKTEVQAAHLVAARNTGASGTLAAPRILEADSKRNPVAKENAAGSVLSRSGVEQDCAARLQQVVHGRKRGMSSANYVFHQPFLISSASD